MPTIGLTGNFGMGKSTVLRMFAEMGAWTYNTDDFVHTILRKDSIINKISSLLGAGVVFVQSGKRSLNKKRISEIVFTDPVKRKALEDIVHPEVLRLIKRTESDVLRKDPEAFIIFEVPLLFEAGYERHFDSIVTVYTTREIAIERLSLKGFTREEALERMRSQMPVSQKKQRSDYVIDNSHGAERTEKRVKSILADIKKGYRL